MSIKLALDINDIIYRIGDKIELHFTDKRDPITGTLNSIFKSVWQPYNICFNLKELPVHISIDTEDVEYIYKVQ